MWIFGRKGASGFSASSTAEEVTEGIDGSGRTAIVTANVSGGPELFSNIHWVLVDPADWIGATSGIGSETARVLALRGVHVIMAVRNTEKAIKVKENIIKDTRDAKVDIIELDLSSMASVRDFVAKYRSSGHPLHILVNNAGVFSPEFKLSKENIELNFATNHLGHFLLTNLLLETMKTTSHDQDITGRIVNVSSVGHRFAYSGTFSDHMKNESSYNSLYAYGLSKLANILHTNELARLLKVEGVNVTANSLHPGFISTEIFRRHSIFSVIFNKILRYFIKDVSQGAATTCYLALCPKVEGVTGEYFSDSNLAKPSWRAKDQELGKELWELSLGLTSLK